MRRERRGALSRFEVDQHDATQGDLARAARVLALRSRREATGLFAGAYASAFRGGGLEFEESRPYVPGDDVRALDWPAYARTGVPHVKRFREERDHALAIALDVSASMACPVTRGRHQGRTRAHIAADAAGLLAAAAGRVNDRVSLVAFSDALELRIPAHRSRGHSWHLMQQAWGAASDARGAGRLESGLRLAAAELRRGSGVAVLSDFRDPGLAERSSREAGRLEARVRALARRNDLISVAIWDASDAELPRAGLVRLADPSDPRRSRLIDTGRSAVRRAYRAEWQSWAERTERKLRSWGSDWLWLRSDEDPLASLMRFFVGRSRDQTRAVSARARSVSRTSSASFAANAS